MRLLKRVVGAEKTATMFRQIGTKIVVQMTMTPYFITSEVFRHTHSGTHHPLAIERVSLVTDLVRALALTDDDAFIDCPRATLDQLRRFHDQDYLAALEIAESCPQSLTERMKQDFNIGINGNPIYPLLFTRPATAAGGTLWAIDRLKDGGIAFNPCGGTHHGRPDRASGFCYLNDAVLGLLGWLDQGFVRIAYVDLDAHHGDGVQDALSHDPRLRVISIHETNRWPYTGKASDDGGGYARNFPVPPGLNDSEMAYLMDRAVLPLVQDFSPQCLMIQCGSDALNDDPLSKLCLSNGALWSAVRALMPYAPRLLVLGGGGYNPWAVGRCWTGIWLTLNRLTPPDIVPPSVETILRAVTWRRSQGRNPPDHWFTTLRDPPNPGPIRSEIAALVDRIKFG